MQTLNRALALLKTLMLWCVILWLLKISSYFFALCSATDQQLKDIFLFYTWRGDDSTYLEGAWAMALTSRCQRNNSLSLSGFMIFLYFFRLIVKLEKRSFWLPCPLEVKFSFSLALGRELRWMSELTNLWNVIWRKEMKELIQSGKT